MSDEERTPPGLVVREATAADNEALIAVERESPIVMGEVEETYDRSPDFFASHRQQGEYRVVLAEVEGRAVGIMVGVLQSPLVQGRMRRLMYVQQARVRPEFHGKRVAWHMANDLFAWCAERGAEGPYYLISPENESSLTFVERGGGRWPVDLVLAEFETATATGTAEPLAEERLGEAVSLINGTHAGADFFEPLTEGSLRERLSRHELYGIRNVYGVVEGGWLVAVAGLWDKGATTEFVHRDRRTGETTRARGAAVADWGYAAGHAKAFATLLRGLAAAARALRRPTLMICEPRPGAVPDPGLPRTYGMAASLFAPTVELPAAPEVRGLFGDLLAL